MELPHLGKHCSEADCRRLDFLPVKCDVCKNVYCGEHYSYAGHNCPLAYRKNVQVPVCPLCNAPVPGKVDELPDIRVSRHIDADCKSDTAINRRQKVYTNRCSNKGCKQKEMIPVLCDKCNLNFCLKHRHPMDHSCSQLSAKPLAKPALAAMARKTSNSNNRSYGQSNSGGSFSTSVGQAASSVSNGIGRILGHRPAALQTNMSEEQALQLALQASLAESESASSLSGSMRPSNSGNLSQEQEDFLLAKAIAESEREAATAGGPSGHRRSNSNCKIS